MTFSIQLQLICCSYQITILKKVFKFEIIMKMKLSYLLDCDTEFIIFSQNWNKFFSFSSKKCFSPDNISPSVVISSSRVSVWLVNVLDKRSKQICLPDKKTRGSRKKEVLLGGKNVSGSTYRMATDRNTTVQS